MTDFWGFTSLNCEINKKKEFLLPNALKSEFLKAKKISRGTLLTTHKRHI